jgi:hypothetical protein
MTHRLGRGLDPVDLSDHKVIFISYPKLLLTKSGIRHPGDFTVLGYGFEKSSPESSPEQYHSVASRKSLRRFKAKLKELTHKIISYSFDTRVRKLKEVRRGWIQYFRLGKLDWVLESLDRWLCTRLRYCIWHNWKKPSRRRNNLIWIGVNTEKTKKWSHT